MSPLFMYMPRCSIELIKHKFKDEIIKNFKKGTTVHWTKLSEGPFWGQDPVLPHLLNNREAGMVW